MRTAGHSNTTVRQGWATRVSPVDSSAQCQWTTACGLYRHGSEADVTSLWLTLWMSLWGSCVRREVDSSFRTAASQALFTLSTPGRCWRVCFVCGNCLWLRGRKEIILLRKIASPLWFSCTASEKSCLCRGCFTLKVGSSRYTKP